MATEPLQVYTGKRVLLEYYNRQNQVHLHLNDVTFGLPARVEMVGTNFNTTVRMYPNLGTPYYGSPRLDYDRIHVSYLGTIVVTKGQALRVWDLLPAINAKYNINLSEEDVENDLLGAAAGSGSVTVNLRIKPESVLFYDGALIYTPKYPDPSTLPIPQVDKYAYWSQYRSSVNTVILDNDRAALMNYEHMAQTQLPITEGKVYWEIKINTGSLMIGIGRPDTPKDATDDFVLGENITNWVLNTATGKLHHNGQIFDYTTPIVAGSTVGVMYDMDAGNLTFILGNMSLGPAFQNLTGMPEVYPVISGATSANSKGTANYGDDIMFYTVPTGYKAGLYTLVPAGGSAPPPPGSGGGTGTNPPAGTILGNFCQDGDYWMVVASGNGGFTLTLTQSESALCGFDEDNYPVIDGGDAGDIDVPPPAPKPILSAMNAPLMMDESAPANLQYSLNAALTELLDLELTVTWGTATSGDIQALELQIGGSGSWTPVTTGSLVTIPAGQTSFALRITPVADLTTEGPEQFQITLREEVIGTLLDNTGPTTVNVFLGDTSLTPIVYPTAPAAPGDDFEQQELYSFANNHVSDFVIDAATNNPTLVWDDGVAQHVASSMVFTVNSMETNRFRLTDELTLDRRVSTSVKMKVRQSSAASNAVSDFGLILFATLENPDTYINNGERIYLRAPTTGDSLNTFKVEWDDKNGRKNNKVIGTQTVSKWTVGTVHTVEYRFTHSDTGGFDAQYFLDGALQATININNTFFTDSLKFRLGFGMAGNQSVKIYHMIVSEKPYVPTLEPRKVRLQGTGSLNIPAGQSTVTLTGRGAGGLNNPFKIDKVMSNRIIKLHKGDASLQTQNPSFNPSSTDMVKLGSRYLVYRLESANSFAYSTDLDSWTIGNQSWNVRYTANFLDRLYMSSTTGGGGLTSPLKLYYTEDGLTAQEAPTPAGWDGTQFPMKTFSDRMYIYLRNATNSSDLKLWTTTDGENWVNTGSDGEVFKNGVSWIMFCANSIMRSSEDGETWSLIPNRPTDFYSYYTLPLVGNGTIMYSAGDYIYVSTDNGVTWENRQWAGWEIRAGFYCNGIFAYRARNVGIGSNEDVLLYGTTLAEMDFMSMTVQENGYAPYLGNIVTAKNRWLAPINQSDNWMISSTLVDWKILSSMTLHNGGFPSVNHYEFDDRVVMVGSTNVSNGNGFAFMSVDLDEEIAETNDGIVGAGAVASVGATNYTFPLSSTPNVPGARNTAVIPGIGNAITLNYNAPVGTLLEVNYLDVPYSGTPVDEPIVEDCEGLDEVARFSDGNGGQYIEILNRNTLECGYVADTLKEATLVGKGFITIPAGTTEVTIAGRGSSYSPITLAAATAPIPVNFETIILPGGYSCVDMAFGNGVYVAIGSVSHITNYFTRKIFYSSDMRNWSMASAALDLYTSVVGFVINRFYVYSNDGGTEVWTSNTGGDDWVQENITTQTGGYNRSKALTANGVAVIWNQGYTASRYASTTDGITWNITSTESYHGCQGMLHNGDAFVTYGHGPADYYSAYYVRSSTDLTNNNNWVNHDIPTLNGTGESQIRKMVYVNGVYFGLVAPKTGSYQPSQLLGFVRGTSLDNIVYEAVTPGTYNYPFLTQVGNYIVILDTTFIKISQDGVTWTTVNLHGDFVNKMQPMPAIYSQGLFSWGAPGFVVARSVATGQQYVSKRAVDGTSAMVTVGNQVKILAGNPYSTTPASPSTETFTVDAGNDTVVVYDCPPGSAVTIEYMSVADNNPTNGTVLNVACDGFNEVTEYANGFGGSYFQVTTYNDPDCGYTVPVLQASLNSNPVVSVAEGSTATINFNLSQPLDVDVSFQIDIANVTASGADYGSLVSVVGGVETPLTSGDEVTLLAGALNFSIKITAIADTDTESDETLTITATAVLNASRILGDAPVTTVTVTNLDFLVQPTQFDNNNLDEPRRFYSWPVRGAGMTDKWGVIRTNAIATIAKYYIPMPSVDLNTTIVGFGTDMATLFDYDVNDDPVYVYPGMDNQGWGLTAGGWYHQGTFNSVPAATFGGTGSGILLDRINGTMDLVINGVAQNYGITGMPTTGDIYMLFGTKDISDPQGFYVEFQDIDTSGYTPPAGYKRGLGDLVEEGNWNPPNPAPSTDILNPATLWTGGMSDSRGMVLFRDDTTIISDMSIDEGIWQVEFVMTTNKPFRIGLCTSTFNSTKQIGGAGANSWGIDSDLLNTYYNNVTTPITENEGRSSTNTNIHMTIDRFNNQVIFNGGNGDLIVFSDELPDFNTPLRLCLSTSVTLAAGGVRVYVNTGKRQFNNQVYEALPGFGTYIGNPVYGTPSRTYCSGIALTGVYHDGDGAFYDTDIDAHSFKCGYVAPAPELVGWNTATFPMGWVATEPGNELIITNESSGFITTTTSHSTGKYYIEFDNELAAMYVVLATTNNYDGTNNGWGGDETNLWLNLGQGLAFWNGIPDISLDPIFYTQIAEQYLGLMIDLDAKQLSVIGGDDSVTLLADVSIPNGEVFFYLGTNYTMNNQLTTCNLGQAPFQKTVPSGYVPWFVPPP